MNISTFQALLTPSGQEILHAATALSPRESEFLIHFQSLCRHYPTELARAALEIAILRLDAKDKFPFAATLYLTRQSLEQASSFEVSSYRSERFRQFAHVADLGCSIGADTIALAKITPTIGLDIDRLRLLMASMNLDALDLSSSSQLIQSDLLSPLPFMTGSIGLFFDPARRSANHRFYSVKQYLPPLSIIKGWLADYPALGVKISPGVNLSELSEYSSEVEFISLQGELKEAVLWFGPLKTASMRATILPGPHQLIAQDSGQLSISSPRLNNPKSYLYEPDPAVIRSGQVATLAEMIDASQMDPDISYLTSHKLSITPFARAWTVMDWFPFQLKRLRAYLRANRIGHVTVKKRGSPLEPEDLRRQLRLKGDQECILVLTHLRGEPIVIICKAV